MSTIVWSKEFTQVLFQNFNMLQAVHVTLYDVYSLIDLLRTLRLNEETNW